MRTPLTRRQALGRLVLGAPALPPLLRPAGANPGPSRLKPFRLTLSWFAQAPVGGFFQALARGYYRDAGLDVTIANGGPQVNALQLLVAGQCDAITGYDFQTLHAVASGMPVVTVATSFQHDLQGMILHAPATSLQDLAGKRILIASSSHQTFWPWLRKRYGLNDGQLAPYTFNLQPFLVSPDIAVQGYASSEMFEIGQSGVATRFFPFSAEGYPPYGTPIVTTRGLIGQDPGTVAAFVKASLLGWRDYLGGDPAPGNALIKQASARESNARLAFGIRALKEAHVLTGNTPGLTALGTMTEARWQATYRFMTDHGLITPGLNWQSAFTTEFAQAAGVPPS